MPSTKDYDCEVMLYWTSPLSRAEPEKGILCGSIENILGLDMMTHYTLISFNGLIAIVSTKRSPIWNRKCERRQRAPIEVFVHP